MIRGQFEEIGVDHSLQCPRDCDHRPAFAQDQCILPIASSVHQTDCPARLAVCARMLVPGKVPPVSESGPLNVRAAVDGTVARVSLHGELDLDRAGAVADELSELPAKGATEVVIDASGLTFIDSSGLRALLTAREQLEQAGASLQLTELSPAVERVLDMTGTRALLTGS
jgi:stage II sporulation protein AA (anti-sigma F factor antagonist)